jgi:hypothetical protein
MGSMATPMDEVPAAQVPADAARDATRKARSARAERYFREEPARSAWLVSTREAFRRDELSTVPDLTRATLRTSRPGDATEKVRQKNLFSRGSHGTRSEA